MSIISVEHAYEATGAVVMMREMKLDDVTVFLLRLLKEGQIDNVRLIINRVMSDPEMYANYRELVSHCSNIQTWLNSEDVKRIDAKAIEAEEKTEEAMATAVAAQSGVMLLGNNISALVARVAALEESSKLKEGSQYVNKRREIHTAPRTTPSMSELGKKAGQKAIQEQREKKRVQESFHQREQIQKDTVLIT